MALHWCQRGIESDYLVSWGVVDRNPLEQDKEVA